MSSPNIFGKTPFLRLLLPVIAGIAVAALFPCPPFFLFFTGMSGLLTMLFSFFVNKKRQYSLRWLFGAGLSLFLCSFAAFQYLAQDKKALLDFSNSEEYYVGTLLDIPETKPRSIACHISTSYPVEKRVILYLQITDQARELVPGDELVFRAKLQPFKNFGNPDDFNYKRYMKIKGISGSAYVAASNWQKTGREHTTLSILSQRCRAQLLAFYQSFSLDRDAYAFISAITLGYKAHLSDGLQEAFRASGTAHVLSVSGLHVGIIYAVINFLFSFLGNHGKPFVARQLLIIISLWAYAFVAGMSAPIIRASFMLTIYCVGRVRKQAAFTYNTLAAAAFLILLYQPFSLFDVSFLMSFMAVFAILFFQPKLRRLYTPKNKASKYIWSLSSVSLSAQLGVFPLVLYFFGSFPTYFFIANLIVVPFTSLVIYTMVPLIAVSLFSSLQLPFLLLLERLFQWVLRTLIELLLKVVYFTETLPFAQLTDQHLTFFQLLFLTLFIYLIAQFLVSRQAQPLCVALVSLLTFFTGSIHEQVSAPPPQFVVFNRPYESEMAIFFEKRRHFLDIPSNGLIPHPEKSILRLSGDNYTQYRSEKPFSVDILILSRYPNFNIDGLLSLFLPEVVVIDSSIPPYASLRLQKECNLHGIQTHDVATHGSYSIYL